MKKVFKNSCETQPQCKTHKLPQQKKKVDANRQNPVKHILFLMALFLMSSTVFGANITWTGTTSTDWAIPSNWDLGHVPTAADDEVIIINTPNQPIISGSVPAVNLMYMNANATLNINSGGTLNVNASVVPSCITMQGGGASIINNGILNTGSVSGFGITIIASSTITNYGTITTNNAFGIVAQSAPLSFTNASTGIVNGSFRTIGASASTITNDGIVNYNGLSYAINFSNGPTFINNGTFNITSGSGISNPAGCTITNTNCAKIIMTGGNYDNEGTTNNAGFIQCNGTISNTGTFTNNGLVKASNVSGVSNNNLMITNACPYFEKIATTTYTISGIYTDAAATISAGVYNTITNKLFPNAILAAGTQTLYAQATNGTCTFIIPYTYNNIKPIFTQIAPKCVGTNSFSLPTTSTNSISGTWSPATSTTTTTTYTFTPTSNVCADTATMTVVINPTPTFTIDGGAYCQSTVTLSGPINTNYTYAWQYSLTGLTTPGGFTAYGGLASSQTVNTGGIYRLIVTNQYGCTWFDTANVLMPDYIFNGSLDAGDLQQTGRINRFGNVSECATPTSFSGINTTSGLRYYDSYKIKNPSNTAVCAKIGVNSGCGTTTYMFSVAYLHNYNPSAQGTDYLADHGSSFPYQAFYEASIPAFDSIEIVIHMVNPGDVCGSYQISVELPRDAAAVSASPATVACNGTSSLTAPLATTYAWSPSASPNQTITTAALNEVNNKYYVTLGYGNAGCTRLDSITIAVQCFIKLNAKVLLSGPYITSTGLMQDSLRAKGILPNVDPYSSAPYNTIFTHINGSGGEIANANLFMNTGNDAIVDWVFVELRSETDFNVIVATKAGLIQRDGDIVSADDGVSPLQFNIAANNYYVAVKHRNHLGVMTANPIALGATPTAIDYTNTSLALYSRATPNHNALPLTGATRILGGKRALYTGNCNIIGVASRYIVYNNLINSDRTSLFANTGATGTLNGYSIFDVDMNGYARFNGLNPDRVVILNNCANVSNTLFVNEQTPN
jgi:hypothetical protein